MSPSVVTRHLDSVTSDYFDSSSKSSFVNFLDTATLAESSSSRNDAGAVGFRTIPLSTLANNDVTDEPGTWLGMLAGHDVTTGTRPPSFEMPWESTSPFSNSSLIDWHAALTSSSTPSSSSSSSVAAAASTTSWWSTSDNITWYDDSYMMSSSSSSVTVSGLVSDEELSVAELYSIYRPSIGMVDKYVTPIWYAIGFPGNLLSFAVWIRPRMRPSSGCYLAALAAGDFLFLLLHLVFELHAAWDVPTLEAAVMCELFPVMFLALQYLSPLLVLAFTVERYIAVCHPFQRERYCTTRRALTTIALLSTGVTGLHAVQAYFWHYDSVTGECGIRPEVTSHGIRSLWTIWSWITELLAFGLVPVTILALNALVIAETRRMSANEARLLGHCRPAVRSTDVNGPTAGRVSGPSATTVMLLAVSFYLILTTLPVTVVYAVYFSFPTGDPATDVTSDVTWQRHLTYWTARTVVQEVGMSHYAGNFLIYVATGRIFRSELKCMLRAICQRRWSAGGDGGGSGTGRASRRRRAVVGTVSSQVTTSLI